MLNAHGDRFTNGLSEFASDLYEQCARSTNDNIIISPYSVSSALLLLSQAAKGKTLSEFRKGLHFDNERADIANKYVEHSTLLQSNVGESILLVANRIYVKRGYTLNKSFMDVAVNKFSSGVELIDFFNQIESAQAINSFVEEKTRNKITNIITPDSISSDDRVVLINAIYFKGNWLYKFNKKNTDKADFYNNGIEPVSIDFMQMENNFGIIHLEQLDAKALELKYANSNFSFVIVLPHQRTGLAALELKLKNYDLMKDFEGFADGYEMGIDVKIPKFRIEYEANLNDALKNLHMRRMFDKTKADLSDLLEAKEQLYVSDVVHKALIEINEEGSEAVASTLVRITYLSANAPQVPLPKFHADHPFVYYIVDRQSNTIVFSGRITKFN